MINHLKKNYVITVVSDYPDNNTFFSTTSREEAYKFLSIKDGYWIHHSGRMMDRGVELSDLDNSLLIIDTFSKDRISLTIERGETDGSLFRELKIKDLIYNVPANTLIYYKYYISGIYEGLRLISLEEEDEHTYILTAVNLLTQSRETYRIHTINSIDKSGFYIAQHNA